MFVTSADDASGGGGWRAGVPAVRHRHARRGGRRAARAVVPGGPRHSHIQVT